MNNLVNWNQVIIYQSELNSILSLTIFDKFSLGICRALILRRKKYFQSLLSIEVAFLFLVIILLFSLNLIVFRNLLVISNNSYGLVIIFSLSVVIALSILLLMNYLFWHQAKRLKTMAIILEKIEEFNFLVKTFKVLGDLTSLNKSATQYHNLSSIELSDNTFRNQNSESSLKIEDILLATRNSLLQSIKFYNDIYLKTGNNIDIYQLFNNLENKLIHFVSLPHENNSKEYQQILEEIINLGLTVHQEVKKSE